MSPMSKLKLNKNDYRYIVVGFLAGMMIFMSIGFIGYKIYKKIHSISRYEQVDPLMRPKSGFNAFAATSLEKIFKDGQTLTKPYFTPYVNISAAQNEYESFQIVISNSSPALSNVTVEISNLVNELSLSKDTIKNDQISVRTVGYVPTKKPYYHVRYVGEWPDPLLPHQPIDIKAGGVQPFWLTVYVPEHTSSGAYRGKVTIKMETEMRDIPVELTVLNFVLPKNNHLKTAFDFYGNILDVRYPGKKPEEYERIKDQFITNMLKHRMNPILNVDPASPIEMAHVDRYRTMGLTNFSVGKKGGTFGNNWPDNDQKIEALLPLYRTYGETLALNKLIDNQYIYTWDEGDIGNPQVTKITSMIKRAYGKLKNMVCYHGIWDPNEMPGWGKDIDIWCFQISNFVQDKLDALKEKGIEIWMYVSGPSDDGTPNLAIDFDSIDYRIIPWLAWKYEIKGVLYWCVNWWPLVNPFESAANTKWQQNGNGLLFYPGQDGPIDSIRAEVFRDGMEDYEYLALLTVRIFAFKAKGLDKTHPATYEQALLLLNVKEPMVHSMFKFSKDQKFLFQQRTDIANTIVQLDKILAKDE
jgi:hypothetical protein